MTVTLLGVTFHVYGFLIGSAAAAGLLTAEWYSQRYQVAPKLFWRAALWSVVGGAVGARGWHVATDWHLYQSQPITALFVWNGGLSILGAVAGAAASLFVWQAFSGKQLGLAKLADIAVFGLPLAQAIGRWGNFVNQELYGLPSNLPWAITIEPAYRLTGFEQFVRYHPLFLYEQIFTAGFWVWLMWYQRSGRLARSWLAVGSGRLFLCYVWLYAGVRFVLDFIRLEKQVVVFGLGKNQVILLLVILVLGGWLVMKWRSERLVSNSNQVLVSSKQ